MFRIEQVEGGKLVVFDLSETKIAGTVATKLNGDDLKAAMRAEGIPVENFWGWQQAAIELAKYRRATAPLPEKSTVSWAEPSSGPRITSTATLDR